MTIFQRWKSQCRFLKKFDSYIFFDNKSSTNDHMLEYGSRVTNIIYMFCVKVKKLASSTTKNLRLINSIISC